MPTPKLKQGLALSLKSLFASLAVFGALELGLRAAGFEPPLADDPVVLWNTAEDQELRIGRGLHRFAVRQLWEPRPLAPIPAAWSTEGERVNAEGYRGPLRPPAKTPGVLRVATLGDSSTFGYGVEYRETFSARLEAELAAAGVAAEVLDFGVVGFTMLQGVERYKERVRAYRPDVVVAAFGSINDHWLAQGAPDAEKIAAATRVPGGFAVFVRGARLHSRVVQAAACGVERLIRTGTRAVEAERAAALEQDALRPHVGEVDLESRRQGRRRVSVDEFRAGLAALDLLVREDGARFVLVSLPRRTGVEYNSPVLRQYSQAIVDQAKASGALLYDGRADFRIYREVERGDATLFFLDGDDVHPSRRGHARLGRGLSAVVLAARPGR